METKLKVFSQLTDPTTNQGTTYPERTPSDFATMRQTKGS
jgi:hypothetical protein